MLEVAYAGEHHAHALGIAVVDAVLVFDGSSRLHHCGDACFVGDGDTVREREEGVGSHHSTFQVEAKLICFRDCLSKGIHSGGLSYTRGK